MPRKHNSGMRGVYLAAAELSRNSNLVVTVTARNGQGADILAYHTRNRRSFAIQVKTNTQGSRSVLRSFWLTGSKVLDLAPRKDFVWILVADHTVEHNEPPEFWVVPDSLMLPAVRRPEAKGWPAVYRTDIEQMADAWSIFDEA
jgi:hypothetical protein